MGAMSKTERARFSPAEVAAVTGGVLIKGRPDVPLIIGVAVDSRAVRGGELFVALPGERVDGHEFVGAALANGAAGALVRTGFVGTEAFHALESPNPGGVARPWFAVEVPDTLRGLQSLASQWLSLVKPLVIGVTGSNGKTTTKDLIAAILGVREATYKNEGNLNTEIGLPLSILSMPSWTRRLVVEMGMRGLGQIASLARLARPTIGVVTNVGLVHLEILGSQEAIARAKEELVLALPRDGVAVLNADDPLVAAMTRRAPCPIITYGLSPDDVGGEKTTAEKLGHVWADKVRDRGLAGIRADMHLPGHEAFTVELPLLGRHNLYNALAAAAAAWAAGAGHVEIREGLAMASLSPMRGEVVIARGGFTIINDAYNASPASMEAAIALLSHARKPGGRIMAALADMLELGSASLEAHLAVGRMAAEHGLDAVYTTGPGGRLIVEGAVSAGLPVELARHFASREELAAAILGDLAPGPGDVILVKGSRGMGMEKVVSLLKGPDDDTRGGGA